MRWAQGSPEPDRPLIDNPQATLADVAYDVQYSIAPSLITCNNSTQTPGYVELGPELLSTRFMIGVVSLAQAAQLGLNTAALQTYASPERETPGIGFAVGRDFVLPTSSSLQTAAALMQPDATLGSWVLPYSDYPSSSSIQNAYPGTMLMSADIPTKGLSPTDAIRYGEYLTFAATTGQVPAPRSGNCRRVTLP